MESVESRGLVEESQQARMSTDPWMGHFGGARWNVEGQSASREDAVPVLPWTVTPLRRISRVRLMSVREKRVFVR